MSDTEQNPERRIALFQRKEIRRTIHHNEWWFVITDVVAALTDSMDAYDYLKKLRKRDPSLSDAFKGGTSGSERRRNTARAPAPAGR
jgi:prophage antirepressor-like protein